MSINRVFRELAQRLQEAAIELSHDDICKSLQDCLDDEYPGQYARVVDVYGDDESGDVVYCCGGQYLQAPYDLGTIGGKRSHNIDTSAAVNVLPRTVYDQEADDDDQYAGAMESADYEERFPGAKALKTWPLRERFISKKTRDNADASDFAGNYDGSPNKKSFPILNSGDVMAAVRSIGRGVAGGHSATSLKNRIKAIAKRKGFGGSLPDSWQGDGDSKDKEHSSSWQPDGVLLVEAAHFLGCLPSLKESAASNFPIKLISPGRGSSGYYSAEVLRKAAETNTFPAGTLMFWNHDTDAEESARPEGDLNRLAAVTTSNAYWDEAGRDGPALYANSKVFGDYADKVKEMGPHIGISIRAGGTREDGAKAPDGKPGVITSLRNAMSVDFVTKAGRGGKIFTEAATAAVGDDMDKAEVQALIESAVGPLKAENQRLKEHLALAKAPDAIRESLADIRLPDAAKKRIVERLASSAPLKDGAIDKAELGKLVEAEAKAEAAFLAELGYGINPASIGVRMSEAEIVKAGEASTKEHEKQFEQSMTDLADLFVGPKLVKGTVSEAERAMRKASRKRFIEGRNAA